MVGCYLFALPFAVVLYCLGGDLFCWIGCLITDLGVVSGLFGLIVLAGVLTLVVGYFVVCLLCFGFLFWGISYWCLVTLLFRLGF